MTLALLLIAAFVATRTGLLLTSYDANQDWEEPVFLFSVEELARDGIVHVFDYQDDLNHGGSVVLLLAAVPWTSIVGTNLVTLKGLAIAWATLTFCAFLLVAWRFYGPWVGLLWGAFMLVLSTPAARLNVTLVGSHPEALLACAAALAAYLEWMRRRDAGMSESAWLTAGLGLSSGLAVWISYLAAMFVVPLLLIRVVLARSTRTLGILTGSLALGLAPWVYQDLWLRPHGAMLWVQRLSRGGGAASFARWGAVLADLADSFGLPPGGGEVLLGLCAIGLVMLASLPLMSRRFPELLLPLTTLPLVASALLGLVLIASADLELSPQGKTYYYYRFFVPLQVDLFLVLALAVVLLASRVGRYLPATVMLVALAFGSGNLATAYGAGNHYAYDDARDRQRGCVVFGHAEWDRAGSPTAAIRRLLTIPDPTCRGWAFGSFGWRLELRLAEDGDIGKVREDLSKVPAGEPRQAACRGFLYFLHLTPPPRLSAEQRAMAATETQAFCETGA